MSETTELPGGFLVVKETYPNGQEYLKISHGKTRIGLCNSLPSGGFLVHGKRKAVPTIRAAVLQMLGDHLNRCKKEELAWRKKLTHFTITNHL